MMEGAGLLLYGFLVLDPIHVHKKDIAIPITHRIRQQRLNIKQRLPCPQFHERAILELLGCF